MDSNTQVKSKRRVADHGEVFTAEREVNDMLDLVKQETERIDSRFLEPACGDGNFLETILLRKLSLLTLDKKSEIEKLIEEKYNERMLKQQTRIAEVRDKLLQNRGD